MIFKLLKDNSARIIKFTVSGAVSAGVNLGTLYALVSWFGLWYLFASAIGFTLSFFVNFFMQKFWSFRNTETNEMYSQMRYFLLISCANLIFNSVLMYVFVDVFGVWYLLSQIFVTGILAVINYILYDKFVFKQSAANEVLKIIDKDKSEI